MAESFQIEIFCGYNSRLAAVQSHGCTLLTEHFVVKHIECVRSDTVSPRPQRSGLDFFLVDTENGGTYRPQRHGTGDGQVDADMGQDISHRVGWFVRHPHMPLEHQQVPIRGQPDEWRPAHHDGCGHIGP